MFELPTKTTFSSSHFRFSRLFTLFPLLLTCHFGQLSRRLIQFSFRFLQILPGSLHQWQYLLCFHYFSGYWFKNEGYLYQGNCLPNILLHDVSYPLLLLQGSISRFPSFVKSLPFHSFHNRVTDNECSFSTVGTTFIW